jgi:hypothetical protein
MKPDSNPLRFTGDTVCDLPPAGWHCIRPKGHVGPCAAVSKPTLKGLTCDNHATPEGKYLVMRRDGTVPPWPSFVLGARDPVAAWALWFYSWVGWLMGLNRDYCRSCNRRSYEFYRYRQAAGLGDPDKGLHRPDDPWVIAKMREGKSS